MESCSYKFKQYVNQIGFYAMIDVAVEKDLTSELAIEYDFDYVDEEWCIAIEFAIRYVYEHYSKNGNKGLSLFVKRMHTMTGDTSGIVVVYVTIMCLCEALAINSTELIVFDEKMGKFIFSK